MGSTACMRPMSDRSLPAADNWRRPALSVHPLRHSDASVCQRESGYTPMNREQRRLHAAVVDLPVDVVDLDWPRTGVRDLDPGKKRPLTDVHPDSPSRQPRGTDRPPDAGLTGRLWKEVADSFLWLRKPPEVKSRGPALGSIVERPPGQESHFQSRGTETSRCFFLKIACQPVCTGSNSPSKKR